MNSNYEYMEVAERILDRIKKCGSIDGPPHITRDDLVELVGANSGRVNCYPGTPGTGCCQVAFFISLTSERYIPPRGRGHLTFRKILEKFVQHMQGHCKGDTDVAILIFDRPDPDALNEWQSNINQIRRDGAHTEAFQITGDKVNPINL